MINCAANCKYQVDGYCALHKAVPIQVVSNEGCPYYESQDA